MSLMERFANPELFEQLSFGEKMAGSTVTMVMGIGITFLVLIILWAFIEIMGKIVAVSEKGAKKRKDADLMQCKSEKGHYGCSQEIAAAIAAAVTVYEGLSDEEDRLVVRKISKKTAASLLRMKMTGTYGKTARRSWTDSGRKNMSERG